MTVSTSADSLETPIPALPRVLLLGWEYAPRLTGGLGTASVRLAHELAMHVELSVIVPRLPDAAPVSTEEEDDEDEAATPPLSALVSADDDGPDALRHFPPSAEWPDEPVAGQPGRGGRTQKPSAPTTSTADSADSVDWTDSPSNEAPSTQRPASSIGTGRAYSQPGPARLTALSHLTPADVRAATAPPRPPRYEVFAQQVRHINVDLPSPYAEAPSILRVGEVRFDANEAQSDANPAQSNETQARSNEIQTQSNETQAQSNETQAQSNETQAQSNETQARSNETQARSNENEAQSSVNEADNAINASDTDSTAPTADPTEPLQPLTPTLPDPLTEALAPFQKPAINPLALPSSNTEIVQFARLAARMASGDAVDVVYAHDWPTFLAGVEIRLEKRVPLVLHVHSTSYDRHGPQPHGWVYELERAAFRAADRIIAVSHYGAEVLRQHYGVDAARLRVVHHGLTAGPLGPQWEARAVGAAPQVLFVGRLTAQKNPLGFVDIARLVADELPNARFAVAGDGPLRDAVRAAADAAGLEAPQFELLGFLDDTDVTAALLASAVVCLPARSEPFGLVALEAAAAGVPLVLSTTTGATEVLPGVLTADWNDPIAMATHVLSLLRDEPARRRAVRENAAAARRLTWERAAYDVMEVFKEVM